MGLVRGAEFGDSWGVDIEREHGERLGCEILRRARSTGTLVGLYRAAEAQLDTDGGPWVTVCEEHGCLVNHTSRRLAVRHLPYPAGWCEACAAGANHA